ncbi:MAG: hypothetical protein PHO83_07195 [Geobacteraceae bacterium]|nr:hypothetical protein [Geobacteraceae bacterium]
MDTVSRQVIPHGPGDADDRIGGMIEEDQRIVCTEKGKFLVVEYRYLRDLSRHDLVTAEIGTGGKCQDVHVTAELWEIVCPPSIDGDIDDTVI